MLKWIHANVGAEFLNQSDFIVTLMSVVLNHINGGKAENEKDRLAAFRTLLRTFIGADDKQLQLTAVYALQVKFVALSFRQNCCSFTTYFFLN